MSHSNVKCEHTEDSIDIFVSYADGSYWKGTACRKCMILIKGINPNNPDDNAIIYHRDGVPDWVLEYMDRKEI